MHPTSHSGEDAGRFGGREGVRGMGTLMLLNYCTILNFRLRLQLASIFASFLAITVITHQVVFGNDFSEQHLQNSAEGDAVLKHIVTLCLMV